MAALLYRVKPQRETSISIADKSSLRKLKKMKVNEKLKLNEMLLFHIGKITISKESKQNLI